MKYFLHDTNAFQDEKITELFIQFGFEGLGLFYTILEKLALQEKPIKTDVLKKQLFIGKKLNKCWLFLETSGLISSNNGETFNENLLKFSEKFQIKKEKNRERISKWRENQALTENVTRYESVCNTPKVKESKVNTTIPSGANAPDKYDAFLKVFNEHTKRSFKSLDAKTKSQFDKLKKAGYQYPDFLTAIKNGYKDSATWNKPQLFTPEYITREAMFLKYLNWEIAQQVTTQEKPGGNITIEQYHNLFGTLKIEAA